MVGPTPQEKIVEIHERITTMGDRISQGEPLQEMEWARLKRELVQLHSVPNQRAEAYVAEAYLWALKLNRHKFDELMGKADAYAGKTFMWHSVRSVCAHRLGVADMVFGLIDYGIPKDDIPAIKQALLVTAQNGMLTTSKNFIYQLERAGVEITDGSVIQNWERIIKGANYLQESNVDEREISKRVSFGCGLVHKLGYNARGYEIIIDPDGGITFEYLVDADAKVRAALDTKIIEGVLAEFDDDMSEHISLATTHKSYERTS